VKPLLYHTILFFLASVTTGISQKNTPLNIGFADSIHIALENTKNLEAQVVGSGLVVVWNNILLDQQKRIEKQTAIMKKKGFKLKPHLIPYFGAIVNAVNVEGIDVSQLVNF
jgi:hypothetical protein